MPLPRLLVLTSTYPRWAGDHLPGFVHELARRLTSGFEVHVLAPHGAGLLEEDTLDGVRVHRFRYAPARLENLAYGGGMLACLKERPLRVLLLPAFLLAQVLAIRRLYRQYGFDAVHAHWLVPQGLAAALASSGLDRPPPILCTSHGGDLFSLRGGLLTWLKRWVLSRCVAVTVVSEAMADEVRRIAPGCRPTVIPMGTDLRDRFFPAAAIRRSNSLLFVGRLVEKKGVACLLRALALARMKRPTLSLRIVGYGPEENRLRELAAQLGVSEAVEFVGPVDQERLPDYYRQATLTIVPSIIAADGDQEGFGLVIVEAMGCESPVIVSSLPAVKDITGNGLYALHVPPGDADALAAALEAALLDFNDTEARAGLARQYVLERFDWTSIACRYADQLVTMAA